MKKGLTFIELVFILALVCGLSVYGVMNYAQKKALDRDLVREIAVKQLQSYLAFYAEKNGFFPVCPLVAIDGFADCLSTSLQSFPEIGGIPVDPQGNGTGECGRGEKNVYCYSSLEGGDGYLLEYYLETDKIKDKKKGLQVITTGFY